MIVRAIVAVAIGGCLALGIAVPSSAGGAPRTESELVRTAATVGAGYLDPRFASAGTSADPADEYLDMAQDRTGRIFLLFDATSSGPGGRDIFLRARTPNGWIDRTFNGGKPLKLFHTTNWEDRGYGYGHTLSAHPTGLGVRVTQAATRTYGGGKVVTLTINQYGDVTAKGWAPFPLEWPVALSDGRLRGCSPAGDLTLDPINYAGLNVVGNRDTSLSPSGLVDGSEPRRCQPLSGVDAQDRLYAVDTRRSEGSDLVSIDVRRWSSAWVPDSGFESVTVPLTTDSVYFWPKPAVVSTSGVTYVAARVGRTTPRTGLVRVESDGSVSAFGGDGVAFQSPPPWMQSVSALQPTSVALVGGNIVMSVHGRIRQADGTVRGGAFLTRVSATTGATDPTFGRQGWLPIPFDAEVSAGPAGRIFMAGTANAYSKKSAAMVQRRLGTATTF